MALGHQVKTDRGVVVDGGVVDGVVVVNPINHGPRADDVIEYGAVWCSMVQHGAVSVVCTCPTSSCARPSRRELQSQPTSHLALSATSTLATAGL